MFAQAYFNDDGSPTLEWAGKTLYADLKLEESKDGQYPPKNQVSQFKKAPVSI